MIRWFCSHRPAARRMSAISCSTPPACLPRVRPTTFPPDGVTVTTTQPRAETMRCLRLGTWAAALGLSLIAAHAGHAQAVASPAEIETKLPPGYVKEFGTMWTFEAPPFDYWKARYGFAPDRKPGSITSAWPRCGCPTAPPRSSPPRGLVMTNHHCARECITAVSTADSNYPGARLRRQDPGRRDGSAPDSTWISSSPSKT